MIKNKDNNIINCVIFLNVAWLMLFQINETPLYAYYYKEEVL